VQSRLEVLDSQEKDTSMIKRALALLALMLVVSAAPAQSRIPTLDDLLTLKSIGGTQISPDGKWVAYTVSYGDFKQDAFITQLWLANSDTGVFSYRVAINPRQLRAGHRTGSGWRFSATGSKTRTRYS
jgi:dipeptidyl aminopeptidase/acylaminoacyl peptidase